MTMPHRLLSLLAWLTFLGVIAFTPLNWYGIMDNPRVPIIAALAFVPLAGTLIFLERQRRRKKKMNITDTTTHKEKSHGSEDGGKAEEILNRIVENLRVFVAIDANGLEVHVFTLDGETYYHLQPRGNGGYIIDPNPTQEVQRTIDTVNEREAKKNKD